jgi:hypothetical protein
VIVRASPADLQAAAVLFKGDGGGAAGFAGAPGTLAFVASAGDEIQGWCWGYRPSRLAVGRSGNPWRVSALVRTLRR